MTESEIEKLNTGRQAVMALDLFKPFLERERLDIITKLKQCFRSNEHELGVYMGLVASLVSLDDLEQKMNRAVNQGRPVAEKVMK